MLAIAIVVSLLFGGVGFGMMGPMLYAAIHLNRLNAAKKLYPNQPWLWRADWARGIVRSSHVGLTAVWSYCIVWNGVSWTIAIPVLFAVSHWWVIALALTLPVSGIGFFVYALHYTLRAYRCGTPVFAMNTVPGVIGGRLEGVIRAHRRVAEAEEVLLALTCIKQRGCETDGDAKWSEETLWRDEHIVNGLARTDSSRSKIPVNFAVPCGLPSTDQEGFVTWKLEATAKMAGRDFRVEFEVPVFRLADASAQNSARINEETSM